MTEKLFYTDPYLKECEAEVVDIINKEKKILVVLDRTPFYPEGGGQPCDLGEINGNKVLYVYEKNGLIYHEMEKAPEKGRVYCRIDFNRRFDHMQQHAGEHLLSGAILKLFKGNNKGFHLGDDYVTVDIDIDKMSEEMIKQIEDQVNNYITANEDICTYMVSKEEISKVPIRKQINVDEDIRIVEAKGMDCCACCGTHVLKTGEIGLIKILKTERNKGMTRIYFKCGKRALKDYENKHEIVTKLARSFSTEENNIIQKVENQSLEIDNLKKELSKLKKKFAENEAENIIKTEKTDIIFKKYNSKNFDDIQLLSSEFSGKKYVLIFVSLEDKKILFINYSDRNIDCGQIFKKNIKEFKGKGGGNATRAQGTFDKEEDLIGFSDFIFSSIAS